MKKICQNYKARIVFTCIFVLVIFIVSFYYSKPAKFMANQVKYGTKVSFKEGEVLQFPDFTLKFLGTKPAPKSDLHVPLGDTYEFEITADNTSQTISWSSGAGEIAPAKININNKSFFLELGMSETLGQLENNQLVINPALANVLDLSFTPTDFVCDCLAGFTFKIPVLKNWEDVKMTKINDDSCVLKISWSGFAEIPPNSPPQLKEPVKPPTLEVSVKKSAIQEPEWHSQAILTNPQGIKYRFLNDPVLENSNEKNFAEFYTENYFVKIEATITNDHYGFPASQFWDTLAETFTIKK
jgi:hypothetical protein